MTSQDSQLFAARHIPQARGFILACSYHHFAIGGKLRSSNEPLMTAQNTQFLTACYIPQPSYLIPAHPVCMISMKGRSHQHFAISGKSRVDDGLFISAHGT